MQRLLSKSDGLKESSLQNYDKPSFIMKEDLMNQITLKGELPDKIGFFLKIYTKVLIFHDPTYLQIKLLDLNSNQINPKFSFRSSDQIEKILQSNIQNFEFSFLIAKRNMYYSNNNVCHFLIRVLPLNYDSETNFELQPVAIYDYPNSIEQEELFYWQVDKETIAVFGQDNINDKSEILFIKPHLIEKAFYIVHTEYQCSYTTMNVTNWVRPNQVAIWGNCNDGTTKPSILIQEIIMMARDKYIADEPGVFMDIQQFYLDSTCVIQLREVGREAKISIINYFNIQKPKVIANISINAFWIASDVDHSYILLYNTMAIEDDIVKFQIFFPIDTRYYQLKIFEQAKIIEKY